jgi:hypothetical protein
MLFLELNLSVCAWCDFFKIIIFLLFDQSYKTINKVSSYIKVPLVDIPNVFIHINYNLKINYMQKINLFHNIYNI